MKLSIWDRFRRFILRIPEGPTLDTLSIELKHPNALVRKRAARSLGDLRDPAAIVVLFDAIHDKNEEVGREVMASLERLGWKPQSDQARKNRQGTSSIKSDSVDELIPLLRDPDPAIRYDAAYALGKLGDPAALDPLLQCLDDPNSSVQQSAHRALKNLGWSSEVLIPQDPIERGKFLVARKQWAELESMGADAVNPLIDALNDKDKYVRWRAARTLGRLGSSRAIEPLMKAFRDQDVGVRKGVVYALGKLTDEQQVSFLNKVLNETDDTIRLEAANIIGLRRDIRIIEPLSKILYPNLYDPDDHVRTVTAEILARLTARATGVSLSPMKPTDSHSPSADRQHPAAINSKADQVGDATSVEAVIEMLEDPKQEVRLQETIYKGLSGNPCPVEPPTQILIGPSVLKKSTASARVGIDNPNATRALIAALYDPDQEMRSSATQALERCRDPESICLLVDALSTSDETVRAWINEILIQIGSPAVVHLILAFKDRNTELRGRAAETLVSIGGPSVELLMSTLKDPSDLVRWRAARTLGEIADPRAIKPLIEALGEDDIFLRRDAANALMLFGAEAVDPLILALQEGQPRIQKEAAEVLGRLGDHRAVKPLLSILENQSSEIRCSAIWALGEIGDPDLEEWIRPFLHDPDHQVQGAVQSALGKLQGKCTESIKSSALEL